MALPPLIIIFPPKNPAPPAEPTTRPPWSPIPAIADTLPPTFASPAARPTAPPPGESEVPVTSRTAPLNSPEVECPDSHVTFPELTAVLDMTLIIPLSLAVPPCKQTPLAELSELPPSATIAFVACPCLALPAESVIPRAKLDSVGFEFPVMNSTVPTMPDAAFPVTKASFPVASVPPSTTSAVLRQASPDVPRRPRPVARATVPPLSAPPPVATTFPPSTSCMVDNAAAIERSPPLAPPLPAVKLMAPAVNDAAVGPVARMTLPLVTISDPATAWPARQFTPADVA